MRIFTFFPSLSVSLRQEEAKKQEEAEWVKHQNLRNEEWALKQVAQAQISQIKKVGIKLFK
jgi:predicted anti-sigma-YlaC factor YlaD